MALLQKAEGRFGFCEEIEFEIASVYDEMECENEATRAYLRVVRAQGSHQAQALFCLALSAAQHGDLLHAQSYFRLFLASDKSGVSEEVAAIFARQLSQAAAPPAKRTRRAHAKHLERRAVSRLNEGKLYASLRDITRSLSFRPTAQGYTLKACCLMMLGRLSEAQEAVRPALEMAPGRVQSLCVLADILWMSGDEAQARQILTRAARHAKATESLFCVAVEAAKHGEDRMTLLLTARMLKREPAHLRALALRACAFANLKQVKTAARLFERLCALDPRNTVFDAYRRRLSDGEGFDERLLMAQDVTDTEALERCRSLADMLGEPPDALKADEEKLRLLLRNADWAMHSPKAGANVTLIAVIMLSALNMPQTRNMLLDCLMDPVLDDGLKQTILKALCQYADEQPVYADLNGQLLRIAAGASIPKIDGEAIGQRIIQRAADALMIRNARAPQMLLALWTAYLARYGAPKPEHEDACSAALEAAYHLQSGHDAADQVARACGVSRRKMNVYLRRILSAAENAKQIDFAKETQND